MNSTRAPSSASKKAAHSASPSLGSVDLVDSLRRPGHIKRPVTPSGESCHTLLIQNLPMGGSLLGTTLYDRMCRAQEPALRSPQVYKNELYGRPFMAVSDVADSAIHKEHALRLKPSTSTPGPHRCDRY